MHRTIKATTQLQRLEGCVLGRRRTSNHDDPPRFHRKGKTWYHVSGTAPRIWTKLSADRAEALLLWAQREGVREDESTKLFSVVAQRYVREVFPTKSIQTRKDNEKELANLLKVFALVPMDAIASTVAGLRWWAGPGGEGLQGSWALQIHHRRRV